MASTAEVFKNGTIAWWITMIFFTLWNFSCQTRLKGGSLVRTKMKRFNLPEKTLEKNFQRPEGKSRNFARVKSASSIFIQR